MRKQLEMEKHNENCLDPFNVRRLYIRGYNKNGKQGPISYGLTCLSCDSFIRENYGPQFKSEVVKINEERTPYNPHIIKKKF